MTNCNSNVAGFLLDGKEPDRTALQFPARNYTYGELRDAAVRMTGHLLALGCQKGDRVLLAAENSFFWAASYLGTLGAGLVSVPLPASATEEDLRYVLEVTESRVAAVPAHLAAKHGALFQGMHLLTDCAAPSVKAVLSQVDCSALPTIAVSDGFQNAASDDLAALMFTSGSTGKPRGVMVSHRNITANTESIIQYLNLSGADRILAALPFHYCFGTSLLHTHLRVGGSLVVDSRFMYPETILQRMLETECTGFAGVPSHFQILLRKSSLRKKRFPHLRYVQQAGGHLAPTLIRELQAALPGKQIFVMYGQTEATARLSYLPPERLDEKLGSIGKGIPGVKLRVVGGSGEDVEPDQVGEIVAEGENIALGYWRAPAETVATFRQGQLHTGDMATIDKDGYIYIVDRARDFLKVGGKRISCYQIEDQLLECRELLEAAIVAIPDATLGEAVKAFVVPRVPGNSEVEGTLRRFCRSHMAPQLVPKEIVVMKALPKNSAGKVLKQDLRRLYGRSESAALQGMGHDSNDRD